VYPGVNSVTEWRWVAFLAALVPVAAFAAVDPGGWYPFGPAKWMAVSVVVTLSVGAALGSGAVRVPLAAGAVWGFLVAWLAVAAGFGVDPVFAWIGTPERHLGWVTWLLFAGCFVVGSQLSGRAEVDRVASGVVVAGAYAAWELFVGQPVALSSVTARLGGTFGSAAYLGAAATLAVPVCTGLAFEPGMRRSWRVAAGTGGGLMVVALLGSGTRAAWIGLAVAVPVVAARSIATRRCTVGRFGGGAEVRREPWRIAARWAVVAVVVAGALVAVGPRLDEVSERSSSAASRADEWLVAVRVIAGAPLLGAGPEGYRVVVGGQIGPEYERAYGREVAPDRAHSGPLDVAATGGIPAAAAYLAMLAMVCAAAWSAVRRLRPVLAGMGVGVIAYAVQQMFLFPVAELDVVFWLLAGILVAESGVRTHTVSAPVRLRVGAVVAAAVALVFFVTGLAGVAADRLARQAIAIGPGPGPAGVEQVVGRGELDLRQ
jgi:O-antigen ligase